MQVSCVQSTKVVVRNSIYSFSAGGPGWVIVLGDFHLVAGPEEWRNEWGHLHGWRRLPHPPFSTPVHFLRSQSPADLQVLHLPCAPLVLCGSKECHWLQGREGEGHWLQGRKVRESQLFPAPLSSWLHKWGQDRTGQRESTRAGEARLANTRFIAGRMTPPLPIVESLGILFPFSKRNQPGVTATWIQVDLRRTASEKGEQVPLYCQNKNQKDEMLWF